MKILLTSDIGCTEERAKAMLNGGVAIVNDVNAYRILDTDERTEKIVYVKNSDESSMFPFVLILSTIAIILSLFVLFK
jgi:hypothetical protein